ncbi:MAG: YdeI/OmpD-associated family protein [Sandaracinaceae bacterium]|nr:YdeI/OmpD-associated family protein [Sandaracinaceae bacterium]
MADAPTYRAFEDRAALDRWLARHHASETELWVRVFKKGAGTPSVTWEDLVLAGLTWGWIDSQKRSLDEVSFLQRMTPRRPRSIWSKKNCEHAERLIAEGRMKPPGLAHVEAAKKDGRWEQAYAGASQMVIPDDFLAALAKSPKAKAFYATLDRTNLYAIYHRLHTAKKPETRAARIERIVAQLARSERFH